MKKIYKIVAVVAVVAAVGFIAYNAQSNKMQFSTLALDNIEAIARGEGPGKEYQTMGYCRPWAMDLMCTSVPNPESCWKSCH